MNILTINLLFSTLVFWIVAREVLAGGADRHFRRPQRRVILPTLDVRRPRIVPFQGV